MKKDKRKRSCEGGRRVMGEWTKQEKRGSTGEKICKELERRVYEEIE